MRQPLDHQNSLQQNLVQQFKHFYANLMQAEWAELDQLYAANLVFADPIHQVNGLPALHHYLQSLCGNVSECRFDYLDELVSEGSAYIKWNMVFAHPKIASNKTIQLRGVTQIEFNDQGIYYHEDFYDMGAMLYEHIPLLGYGVRWLKHNIASATR